ncbi:MAG: peptide deformylase [bacterium]|nr:peptide deformylase [bacterium]
MLKIVTTPNPVLSKIAEPYCFKKNGLDEEGKKLIEEMKKTLDSATDPEGVGLAAPQVGKSLQIFIVKETPKSSVKVFINPRIVALNEAEPNPSTVRYGAGTEQHRKKLSDVPRKVQRSSAPPTKLEGCLSLPNIWGFVKRNPKIKVSYYNENGQIQKEEFSGFLATIIQHEVDHLNGTLFPKHVLEQKTKLYKSYKNKKGEDEFEEIEI